MKTIIVILLLSLVAYSNLKAQPDINGAWNLAEGKNQHQLLFQNGFFFHTVYQENSFIMTRGGTFSVEGNTLKASMLLNSEDSSQVNNKISVPFSISSDVLLLNIPQGNIEFKRVDNGNAPLASVWKITERMGDEEKVKPIHQTGTRQTYKVLTGTRFQWVAIDPGKKQFSGTGGGSYTFKDGKYTETIAFFSRDDSRVGASLVFDSKLEDGKWHHSGLSSKGVKIYEIWSKVSGKDLSKP